MRQLDQLYTITTRLFADPNNALAGLDWVDRVLPFFTRACRKAVTTGSGAGVADWSAWLSGSGVEAICEAGDAEIYAWRRGWLRVLIDAVEALRRDGRNLSEFGRAEAAGEIALAAPTPFSTFPQPFWLHTMDMLAGASPGITDGPAAVSIAFPLVLAEQMVVDGDPMDTLTADFVVEETRYAGAGVYPDPATAAVRAFDAEFLNVFSLARDEVSRHFAADLLRSAVVRLQARRPEHDVFLQKLVLRGCSGGGALVAALSALHGGYGTTDHLLAISFALRGVGAAQADGQCHAVGGAYEKVRGCAKDGIRRLLVSEEQAGQVRFYGHLQNVAIVGAAAITDALRIVESSAVAQPPVKASAMADDDGGVLPLNSLLYLERKSDGLFQSALARRPMIVLVKGARQIGKTSLLVRGVESVRRTSARLIYVDLQSMGRETFQTQKDFFFALARVFSRELKLDVALEDMYDDRDGPNKNFETYLFRYVLDSPVIWFMDEVDRLFDFGFYTDVFSLMRSWHNRRPIQSELANLTLVLAYATETHLMIEDAYQSPFNVGVKVELEDFTPVQIATLNDRLGSPLAGDAEQQQFFRLVGGHPHLVCRGLSWMAQEHRSLDDFAAQASLDGGPFGGHLRHLRLLAQNPELLAAVKEVISGGACRNNDSFLHLRSAGVVVGDDNHSLSIRSKVYSDYLCTQVIGSEAAAVDASAQTLSFWSAFYKRGELLRRSIIDGVLRRGKA